MIIFESWYTFVLNKQYYNIIFVTVKHPNINYINFYFKSVKRISLHGRPCILILNENSINNTISHNSVFLWLYMATIRFGLLIISKNRWKTRVSTYLQNVQWNVLKTYGITNIIVSQNKETDAVKKNFSFVFVIILRGPSWQKPHQYFSVDSKFYAGCAHDVS